MATSSDSKRQPRATSAQRALADPQGRASHRSAVRSRTAACTSRKRAVDVHEPVQPRLQHREPQVRGRSLIADVTVQIGLNLAPERREPADLELDHEIRKLA